jgi:hypothetical protein
VKRRLARAVSRAGDRIEDALERLGRYVSSLGYRIEARLDPRSSPPINPHLAHILKALYSEHRPENLAARKRVLLSQMGKPATWSFTSAQKADE